MSIITLTTDMGSKDYYVAATKGAIWSQMPDVNIVDITHEIKPFDSQQAAFVVKNAWSNFPAGTVHIIGVNADQDVNITHLIVEFDGQYFIGADNGIFALLFDRSPDGVFELNLTQDSDELTFPTKNLFAKAAAHLARGGTPEVIGKRIDSVKQATDMLPVVENDVIKGSVIYVDVYGNVITNISRQIFKDVGKGREFAITFKRASFDIKKIHNKYNDVPEGEKVALFSHAGLLEIAINKGAPGNGGGASGLFGLVLSDIIRIDFNADTNRKNELSIA